MKYMITSNFGIWQSSLKGGYLNSFSYILVHLSLILIKVLQLY